MRPIDTAQAPRSPATPHSTQQGAPLLEVEDLHVEFDSPNGIVHAVNGVSFSIAAGQTLGIVGESGSGKSVTARTIMRLIPQPPGRITAGRVMFEGTNLLDLTRREMQAQRGAGIAMVFQDPMRSLNPTIRIGKQIVEAIRVHEPGTSRKDARQRALELLDAVQIPSAAGRLDSYPHQLSGGMRQRVMIAMALSCRPRLLIADEPTTALDVTIQAQILDLLAELQDDLGMAMILVTHDLGVAAWHTHEIAVMYAGRIVEHAPTVDIFDHMRMPYTEALLESIPRIEDLPHSLLPAIPGQPPDPVALPTGCPFHPRCPYAQDDCVTDRPALTEGEPSHQWACWHPLTDREVAHGR